jgi:hypothetical protein
VKPLFKLATLLAVSCSLTGAVAGAHPAAPVAGTVVFTSTRDGDAEIYAINPDGSGLTHLTDKTSNLTSGCDSLSIRTTESKKSILSA